jgi:glucosamine--fructose-6-phosphate aminotransferase (isomerizing)
MCGIIAGISINNVLVLLVQGLEKLEYRGYDSTGLAMLIDDNIDLTRTIGKVVDLKRQLSKKGLSSNIGISHTRWATHGAPSVKNAHPHVTERVAIVHNGIIENYKELKKELLDLGYEFKSDTDSEIVANLLDYYIVSGLDPEVAANKTISRLEGSYALVFMFKDCQFLFAATKKNSLILGLSEQGTYIASDTIAFDKTISNVIYLEDGDKIVIREKEYNIFDKDYQPVQRVISKFLLSEEASKKDYQHFMLKEIHEQPLVIKQALDRYLAKDAMNDIKIDWNKIDRIKILACGSAYHSGLVAKYWLEALTNIPVDAEIASEYRYRKSPSVNNGVTIVISQSGETLDTLEALKKAKASGQIIVSIVNTERSSIARIADYVLPIMVGAEIGVASTKAFLGQLIVLAALSLDIGVKTNNITDSKFNHLRNLLLTVPDNIRAILAKHNEIKNIAAHVKDFKNSLFIARGVLYPIALEGSLKLKELSYIHAEGYAGGELKHGSISLIDDNMLVVALMPSGDLFEKMFSNLQEVIARGAKVLCITGSDNIDKVTGNNSAWSAGIASCEEFIAPMIYTVPLQLLAYYTADLKGNNVDQPRNLAKSVTVE